MRRRLFTIGSALSLLLCAATCAMWVRSYWVPDRWERAVHGEQWDYVSWRGRIRWSNDPAVRAGVQRQIEHIMASLLAHDRAQAHLRTYAPDAPFVGWDGLPSEVAANVPPEPPWPAPPPARVEGSWDDRQAILATAILPAVWLAHTLFRSRRRRRKRAGRCRACGYDLRATPRAGGDLLPRCPECGLAPAGAA